MTTIEIYGHLMEDNERTYHFLESAYLNDDDPNKEIEDYLMSYKMVHYYLQESYYIEEEDKYILYLVER